MLENRCRNRQEAAVRRRKNRTGAAWANAWRELVERGPRRGPLPAPALRPPATEQPSRHPRLPAEGRGSRPGQGGTDMRKALLAGVALALITAGAAWAQ